MSNAIKSIASFIANVLKFHKAKIFLVIMSTILIGIMIFPYDDLGDLFSATVSKVTNNQVYVQFEKLGIDPFPTPGVSMDNVELDTPVASGIKADRIEVAPSIPSLLLFKAGGNVDLKGFLNGDLGISFQSNKSFAETDGSGHIEIDAQDLDLAQVVKVMNVEFPLKGRISMEGEGDLDAQFQEPARAEFEITGEKLQMMPTMFTIPQFGPMNLPGINFSNLTFKGRFLPQEKEASRGQVNQDLIFEEVIIGSDKDPLQGRVRGKLSMVMMNSGGGVRPLLGDYELRVQITAKPAAQKDFGLFLSFLEQHKKETGAGSVYSFRVAGRANGAAPNITTLQVFQ